MTHDDVEVPPQPQSHTRRHVLVLAVLVAAFGLGSYLVVTGDDPVAQPPPSTAPSPPLRDLGTFASQKTATEALQGLDPATLRLPDSTIPGPSTTARGTTVEPGSSSTAESAPADAIPTVASLKRCEVVIAQQTSDRQIGDLLAAGRLRIGPRSFIVTSYGLPASGDKPATTRTIVSDAVSCQIAFAIGF